MIEGNPSQIPISFPRKCRVSHWQKRRFKLFAIFSEFVQVLGDIHFISFAASGFHAETFKYKLVENREEEENNTYAKCRGGRAYI